jgi:hypothetical protein
MPQASDVVEVNVRFGDAVIDSVDLSTVLGYVYHTQYADLVRTYDASNWAETLTAEGFPTDHVARAFLSGCFKQDPKPGKVKLGRRSAAETQSVRITPVTKGNMFLHSLQLEQASGTLETAQYQEDGTPAVSEICTGLAAAINALNADVTANGTSGTHVDVVANSPNVYFTYKNMSNSLSIRDTTAAAGDVAADLDAIKSYDPDWYGLAAVTSSPIAMESCADWVEANGPRIFVPSTHDQGLVSNASDDLGTSIKNQSYLRTLVSHHSKTLQFFGGSWMASMLTYEPGQADWFAKTVIGAEPDRLTATQEQWARTKYVTTYGTLRGAPWTGEAWTGSGRFIDQVLTRDWLEVTLQGLIIAKFKALPKVAMTNEGVGAIVLEAMMDTVKAGQANGAIDTDPATIKYIVPAISSVSAANKSARYFPGNVLSCRGTGGAHKISITVNLAV